MSLKSGSKARRASKLTRWAINWARLEFEGLYPVLGNETCCGSN
jgi:hypothetical protein